MCEDADACLRVVHVPLASFCAGSQAPSTAFHFLVANLCPCPTCAVLFTGSALCKTSRRKTCLSAHTPKHFAGDLCARTREGACARNASVAMHALLGRQAEGAAMQNHAPVVP